MTMALAKCRQCNLNNKQGRRFTMEPKPELSDCCGSGCSPCVFDIYEQHLKLWNIQKLNGDKSLRKDLLSEIRFKPFQLTHKDQLTEDVFLFQFKPYIDNIATDNLSGFLPYGIGQHLILRCRLNPECCELSHDVQPKERTGNNVKFSNSENQHIVTRAYTPVSLALEEENCCFRIFAKLYKNGIGSEYLRDLQVGDTSFWRGPYGQFDYKPNRFKYILMACVGTGLAPMIPIANYILSNDNDETIIHLIYGTKNIEHIIMRDSLREMAQFWNFTLEYYFSEDVDMNSRMKFGENFWNKKIDRDAVNSFVQGKDLKLLQLLVCGTDSFISSMKTIVSDMNIDSKNVFIF